MRLSYINKENNTNTESNITKSNERSLFHPKKSLANAGKEISMPNFNQLLTEDKYNSIKNKLRKDYFSRLEKVSINKFSPIIIKAEDEDMNGNGYGINQKNLHSSTFPDIEKKKMFSNAIRKINFSWIKEHPRKKHIDKEEARIARQVLSSTEDYRKEIIAKMQMKERELPKIKKVYKDYNEIKYKPGYIDEVEKLFIKPYLSKSKEKYIDFVKIEKSKVPFNFIIS